MSIRMGESEQTLSRRSCRLTTRSRQRGTAIVFYLVLISLVTISAISSFKALETSVINRTAKEAAAVGFLPLN